MLSPHTTRCCRADGKLKCPPGSFFGSPTINIILSVVIRLYKSRETIYNPYSTSPSQTGTSPRNRGWLMNHLSPSTSCIFVGSRETARDSSFAPGFVANCWSCPSCLRCRSTITTRREAVRLHLIYSITLINSFNSMLTLLLSYQSINKYRLILIVVLLLNMNSLVFTNHNDRFFSKSFLRHTPG